MEFVKIKSITSVGKRKTFDLKVEKNHNFYLANGILTHNSGKSVALPFIKTIADRLGVTFFIYTGEISLGKLVGTFERGFDKGKTVIKKVEGVMDTLKGGGIIHFDEADVFLSSEQKEYNIGILSYVQTALNPIGSPSNKVTRDLVGGHIEFSPECSFSFTTFPIKTKMIGILKRGFFQRVMPYCKILTKEEWDKLTDEVIDMMYERQIEEDKWRKIILEEAKEIDDLVNRLIRVREFVNSLRTKRIIWGVGVKECFKITNKEVGDMISSLPKDIAEVISSFRVRTLVEINSIAVHKALLDMRTTVEVKDVLYAKKLIITILRSMIETVEGLEEVAQKESVAMMRWKKLKADWGTISRRLIFVNGSVDTTQFIDVCREYLDVSEPSMRKYVTEWEKKKLLTRTGGGRSGSWIRL